MFANDISDFELEGISVGESLLKYFNENEINQKVNYPYVENGDKNKERGTIYKKTNLNQYERVLLTFKNNKNKYLNDRNLIKYEIVAISGSLLFNESTNCKNKQNEIFQSIKNSFPNITYHEGGPYPHPGYPNGEVIVTKQIGFYLDETKRTNIDVICFDQGNSTHYLAVTIRSHEQNEWLVNIYK